jgi:subtilase family serine protease
MRRKQAPKVDISGRAQNVELMEPRLLLSRTVTPITGPLSVEWLPHPVGLEEHYMIEKPDSGGLSSPYGGTAPAQMRAGYGASSISFGGTVGDGTGQTIALIDAYDDPNAASDLAAFDTYFGLAAPPSFTKLNQNGAASPLPGTDPGGPNNANGTWEEEESLDIEWAHVMAPKASLILYEASSNLNTAIASADANSAVTVISMSFGGSQYSGETSLNSTYFNQTGVTYLASTGDNGTPAGEPASLSNVIAVGGTSFHQTNGNYSSESGWSGSGGGVDSYDPQPSYQSFTVSAKSTTLRTTPDVSIDADPSTGVPIYDSWDFGATTPWVPGIEGGTSLASPMWAGLVAVADQGRVLSGQSTLSGLTQTLPRLYELPASNYHDITTGSNGLAAGAGYDLVTGIGSPIASVLVPDLAGAATVTGRVFVDNLGTGAYTAADAVFANKTVYLDLNNDGVQDNSEPSTTTNSSGVYTFANVPAGGTVRLSTPGISGYIAIAPASAAIAYGTTDTVNFTYFPTAFTIAAASTNDTLQLDSTGTYEQILVNGTLTYSIAKSLLGTNALTFTTTSTGDSLTINGANGNPVTTGGITLVPNSGNAALNVAGTTSGSDAFVVTSSSITFNGNAVNFSHVSTLTLNPGTGADSLAVNSGSVTIAAPAVGAGFITRNFSSFNVSSGASALLASAASHSDRSLVITSSLSDSGQIDLGANDMIVHNGNLTTINTLLTIGFNGGAWTGTGIDSSAAASDTTHLTAVGFAPNTAFTGKFDNITPAPGDVLLKYTYYGDANLSGTVDGSDYTKVDAGFGNSATLTGWYNGNFNYDTHIDGSDYTLVDNAFNTQGVSLAAQFATPSATAAIASAAPVFSTAQSTITTSAFSDSSDKRRKAIDDVGL